MAHVKKIVRISVWLLVSISILWACVFYYVGDINRLKKAVEKNLKNQLNCTIKLGELDWDLEGLKFGFTTSAASLYDLDNNIVLQAGPTRIVWDIRSILLGQYAHFDSIDSADLYLKAIRNEEGKWNLIEIFPPGPPPKIDNLRLHNSIVYLIDHLNPSANSVLYKDLNLLFIKQKHDNRRLDLTTRLGSLNSSSFVKIKGYYTEKEKFDWRDSAVNLYLIARNVELDKWQGYVKDFISEPEINRVKGNFTGVVRLKKGRRNKLLDLRVNTKTKDFAIAIKNQDVEQLITIPKTKLSLRAFIDQEKIKLRFLKSDIDELSYKLSGYIYNWSEPLVETDLYFRTNKFNFKNIKPYLPLSLLPASTRDRIKPINDDGYVKLDVKLKGPLIAPTYNGTVLLSEFDLTPESGFLSTIHDLEGKLTLDEKVLNIDYLNIPIRDSVLSLQGKVDEGNLKSNFSVKGKSLDVHDLLNLLTEAGYPSPILDETDFYGELDLDLDVVSEAYQAPEIMGKLVFHDVGAVVYKEELLQIEKVFGEFALDGSKITFDNLNGLINDEGFFIHGDLSLQEDQKINLLVEAEHLKVIPYVLSKLSAQTPLKPVADTITGKASDVNLSISGSIYEPTLYGMLSIHDIAFNFPNLEEGVSGVEGVLTFEGQELIIDNLQGKIQNSNFTISGFVENLLSDPKPKIRLVTEAIELNNIWKFLQKQLQSTSLKTQAEELEELTGTVATDIFVYRDAVLGDIYFKDIGIKHKLLPFALNNLSGKLVVSEKDLNLLNVQGAIDGSNNFSSNITVSNYLDPSFYVEGMLSLDLDLPSIVKAIDAPALDVITVDGLIPSTVNFNFSQPIANINFHTTLSEMLQLDIPPYISKPTNKDYIITGDVDFDIEKMGLYINRFNIKSKKLSLVTNGSIRNITSSEPDLMIYFNTDEPTAVFMITEPITPLMDFKMWGMINLSGSISGTPSMYAISSVAKIRNIRMPKLFGRKLKATDGEVSIYLDDKQGALHSRMENITYVSFKAKAADVLATYLHPTIKLDELVLEGAPGEIHASGIYNLENNSVSFGASGSNLELSSLGSFVFLDPGKVSGMTDFSLVIDGQGKTQEELISNSKGNLSFAVSKGHLGHVGLLHKGLQVANIFGQGIFGFNLRNIFSLFFKYEDGDFDLAKGSVVLDNGMIKLKELLYRAKNLFLNSFGFVDLNNSFIKLAFYGYLPENEEVEESPDPAPEAESKIGKVAETAKSVTSKTVSKVTDAITIVPNALEKRKIYIPFLSLTPPRYFKFEIKGDLNNSKKITRHAGRSFKWLKGRRLEREYEHVPKTEEKDAKE